MCLKDLEIRSRGSSPVSLGSSSSSTSEDVYESRRASLPRTVLLLSRRSTSLSTRSSSNSSISRPATSILPTLLAPIVPITAGALVCGLVTWFSWVLPYALAPHAAVATTYQYAQWQYDAQHSHFDNSIYTYGTDYFLALCMLALIPRIPCPRRTSPKDRSKNHPDQSSSFAPTGWYTRGLLASYMISVAAGGAAHQYYTTVAAQNTIAFRVLWTVCVGAVAIASGFMGAAATQLRRLSSLNTTEPSMTTRMIPEIPTLFWFAYALGVVAICMYGGFSFQRPACDIFVVGITQFPSTFYMMLTLWFGRPLQCTISPRMRLAGCAGFIFNAPLLPLYPLLVQYSGWSLGGINTLLHAWLLVAWSGQGLALRHVGRVVANAQPSRSKTHVA